MKYLYQLCMIVFFSFLGELCRFLIPYPIPASIYGMLLMFCALGLHLVPCDMVRDTGSLLTTLLPVMFVAPVVNLMDCWDQLKENLIPLIVIILASTVVVFVTSGAVTQIIMNIKKKKEEKTHA